MPTLLPTDDDNRAIPAMRLRAVGGAQSIAATATTTRNATAFAADTQVVSLYATVPVYVRFGSGSITATTSDHFFPDGLYYDFAIAGGDGKGPHFSNVAVLAVSASGTVYISEKE